MIGVWNNGLKPVLAFHSWVSNHLEGVKINLGFQARIGVPNLCYLSTYWLIDTLWIPRANYEVKQRLGFSVMSTVL